MARYVVVRDLEGQLLFAHDESGLRWSLTVEQAHQFRSRPKARQLAAHLGPAALFLPLWFAQHHLSRVWTKAQVEAALKRLPFGARKRIVVPQETPAIAHGLEPLVRC